MTTDPLTRVGTRRQTPVPQSEPTDERQVQNNAGGYVFSVGPEERLRRFLTLGVAGGTFYVQQQDLTVDNAQALLDLIADRPRFVVDQAVEVSVAGRAPKQQPALFALAATASLAPEGEDRRYAMDRLRQVARTGYTLYKDVQYLTQFRGWGRVMKRGIQAWYLDSPVDWLAFQAVKYRQRDGWTHRDLLRLAHPKPAEDDLARRALFDWICGRTDSVATEREWSEGILFDEDDPLRVVEGYERVQRAASVREARDLVAAYHLPWEALPDRWINEREVWEALLENNLPPTALLRQLPRLTRIGLLDASDQRRRVVNLLTDEQRLRYGRVHPINVLFALDTYRRGRSFRGKSTWTPVRQVVDALDRAFYAAFGAVEPTGKRTMLALDVSGSMTGAQIAESTLTAREASAALALVTANVEDDYRIFGFTDGDRRTFWQEPVISELTLSPRQRLDDVVNYVGGLGFGRTDCSLPMRYALDNRLEVDTFVVYTDSETWSGTEHPHVSLRRYRERTGIPARLVVVGMTATYFTIADPNDAGMLDVAGFDAAVPNTISSFARGEL